MTATITTIGPDLPARIPDTPQADEIYREIGRFTVAFSTTIDALAKCSARLMPSREGNLAVQAAVGSDMAGRQLASMFFAICADMANFDDDERAIQRLITRRLNGLTEIRNDFAHGNWFVPGMPASGGLLERLATGEAHLERMRSTRTGTDPSMTTYSASSLRELVEEASELRDAIVVFASGADPRENFTVSDVLGIEGGKLVVFPTVPAKTSTKDR